MVDINLKLIVTLAMCHNLQVQKVENKVKQYGLNSSEFGVLDTLFHGGPQTVQHVAEKIQVTSGTMTYIINKLQEKELIIRRKCEKDKRVYYISLTDTGRDLIDKVLGEHKEFLEQVFQDIDDDIKEQTIENLLLLYKKMSKSLTD